jgi:hypothetical protein
MSIIQYFFKIPSPPRGKNPVLWLFFSSHCHVVNEIHFPLPVSFVSPQLNGVATEVLERTFGRMMIVVEEGSVVMKLSEAGYLLTR